MTSVPAYVLIPPFTPDQFQGLEEIAAMLDSEGRNEDGTYVVVDDGDAPMRLPAWLNREIENPQTDAGLRVFYKRLFDRLNP